MKNRKLIFILALSLLFMFGCQNTNKKVEQKEEEKQAFTSSLTEVSQNSFKESLDSILGQSDEEIPQSDDERINIIITALDRAGFLNIADTYSDEKLQDAVKGLKIEEAKDFGKYLAVAKDVFGLDDNGINSFLEKKDEKSDLAFVQNLEGQVLKYQNKLENFIGLTSDKDIYQKLNQAYNEFTFFKGNPLEKLGMEAILDGTTTGYNVKYKGYKSNFDPNLTIVYSHDNIRHAQQLIKLLADENIKAKVQLEPKTSSFEYMIDWGPVPEPTDKYEVVKIGENRYLANALEYDLLFEFENEEDLNKFDGLILQYAKKNEGNEEGKGLLYSSWWQPLYHTAKEMKEGYEAVTENIISKGNFEMYSITKNEDAKKFSDGLLSKDNTLKIESNLISVDQAFYRYLNGDFK